MDPVRDLVEAALKIQVATSTTEMMRDLRAPREALIHARAATEEMLARQEKCEHEHANGFFFTGKWKWLLPFCPDCGAPLQDAAALNEHYTKRGKR